MKNRLQNQKGMSLFEILIVLGIIGTVMGLVLSRVFSSGEKAKTRQAKGQIMELVGNFKLYREDNSKFPTTEEGVDALVEAGFYSEKPLDPWGNDFIYESPGSHGNKFEVSSMGPDGEADTKDDIISWKKDE